MLHLKPSSEAVLSSTFRPHEGGISERHVKMRSTMGGLLEYLPVAFLRKCRVPVSLLNVLLLGRRLHKEDHKAEENFQRR